MWVPQAVTQELDRIALVGDLPERVVAGVETVDVRRKRRVKGHRRNSGEGDLADLVALVPSERA